MPKYSFKMLKSSICLIDRTFSRATTLNPSGLGSDINEGILRITQSSSITGALRSDCLMQIQDTCILSSQLTKPNTIEEAIKYDSQDAPVRIGTLRTYHYQSLWY